MPHKAVAKYVKRAAEFVDETADGFGKTRRGRIRRQINSDAMERARQVGRDAYENFDARDHALRRSRYQDLHKKRGGR